MMVWLRKLDAAHRIGYKITELEKELAKTRRKLAEADEMKNHTLTKANSFKTALEREQKHLIEEKSRNEAEMAVSWEAAINDFLKSSQFEKDLGELVAPSFVMGFTATFD